MGDHPPTKLMKNAIFSGDSEKVHNLLRSSNHTFWEHFECPLLCTVASKGYGDIVGLLLRHGVQINAKSSEGSTALIYAADNGNLPILSLLLNAGADMNITNRNGETALARATRRGLSLCARLLLSHGANPQPIPSDGHSLIVSPLHLARQLHQTAIEHDILARMMTMENLMLEVVAATLPEHLAMIEPGHLVDAKTLSFFPIQLISTAELNRFTLYFKTPPGYSGTRVKPSDSTKKFTASDELILVYVVRAQLTDTGITCWLNGPAFQSLRLNFNGTQNHCTEIPTSSNCTGIHVFSISTSIKQGGLNTLCLEEHLDTLFKLNRAQSLVLIGAYRIRLDVTSLIQSTVKLGLGSLS